MFERIRKCLDDFENAVSKFEKAEKLTEEEWIILDYFYLNMAKAMSLECPSVKKIAKIILLEKD